MADSSITSTCYKHHTRTGIPRLEILSKPRFTYSWSKPKSPQEAMVTGDCGGVREHGTFGNGSIEEPERSTVVSARSGNEQSMLDEWSIPEKGKRCSGSRIRW